MQVHQNSFFATVPSLAQALPSSVLGPRPSSLKLDEQLRAAVQAAGPSFLVEGPEPVDISFRKLHVTVIDGRTGVRKPLLHGVSGDARAGHLLAIMGTSGAGKSTLLDVLSANLTSSAGMEIAGQLLVNGRPRKKRLFQRTSCYVQQRDILMSSSSVREAITFSALLKLPASMPKEVKMARVEAVLSELELEGCADTLIGDEAEGIKGISGGQKRRVSLGIELVKDPAVIFLDEPTSGLDSEVALSCMEVLRHLAKKGRTVLCTIHQPNSDITALFDDFMLLSAGHIVYSGPWNRAVDFFAAKGHACPKYKNPCDFFLAVLGDSDAAEELWLQHEADMTNAELPPGSTPALGNSAKLNVAGGAAEAGGEGAAAAAAAGVRGGVATAPVSMSAATAPGSMSAVSAGSALTAPPDTGGAGAGPAANSKSGRVPVHLRPPLLKGAQHSPLAQQVVQAAVSSNVRSGRSSAALGNGSFVQAAQSFSGRPPSVSMFFAGVGPGSSLGPKSMATLREEASQDVAQALGGSTGGASSGDTSKLNGAGKEEASLKGGAAAAGAALVELELQPSGNEGGAAGAGKSDEPLHPVLLASNSPLAGTPTAKGGKHHSPFGSGAAAAGTAGGGGTNLKTPLSAGAVTAPRRRSRAGTPSSAEHVAHGTLTSHSSGEGTATPTSGTPTPQHQGLQGGGGSSGLLQTRKSREALILTLAADQGGAPPLPASVGNIREDVEREGLDVVVPVASRDSLADPWRVHLDEADESDEELPPTPLASLPRSAHASKTSQASKGGASKQQRRHSSPESDMASWGVQVGVQFQRRLNDWLRNPTVGMSELVQYIFIGCFIGLAFFRSFDGTFNDQTQNRFSCIWFLFAALSFTPGTTAINSFMKERYLLKREASQRMYSVTTFYIARSMVVTPFQGVLCLLFVSIAYFWAGFYVAAGNFFTFVFTLFVYQMVSEGIGFLCAIVTNGINQAAVLQTFVQLIMLSFSGYLITKIPVYFRWVQKISYLTWAYAGLVVNEFNSISITLNTDQAWTNQAGKVFPAGTQVPGRDVYRAILNPTFDTAWPSIGILAAIAGAMEVLKLLALQWAYHRGKL